MKYFGKALSLGMALIMLSLLPVCAEEAQNPTLSARYAAVLKGEENFTTADENHASLNISEAGKMLTEEELAASVKQFACADLDGDGIDEVVLLVEFDENPDGGYVVLCETEEGVLGYALPMRGFLEPKADGTFSFSSGAADSGFGRLTFAPEGYEIVELAASHSEYDDNNELSVQYFVNGEACSEEDFNSALEEQAQKDDLAWQDFTDEAILALSENS